MINMETEIIKEKCKFCGEEKENVAKHERFCSKNPDRVNRRKEPKEAKEESHIVPLIISDVQATAFDADMVAWFVDVTGNRIKKQLNHVGIVHNVHGDIPVALVLSDDGSLVPPYLIQGFLGVLSEYYQFPEKPEPEQTHEEVQQRELQNEFKEPIIATQSEEKPARVIIPPETHAQEPEKKSIFAGIFGKKEKKEKDRPEVSNSELAREIINASKTA